MSESPACDRARLRSADGLPARDTGTDDLDVERVAADIAQATGSGRYTGPREPPACLRDTGVTVPAAAGAPPSVAVVINRLEQEHPR